nr:MAG TPA: hypothetical protein [Caudoviricetes sp.]
MTYYNRNISSIFRNMSINNRIAFYYIGSD